MKKSVGILSSVIMATSLLAGPVAHAEEDLQNGPNDFTYIDEVELNDTFSSANQTLSNDVIIHGTFSESDEDYYKVEVTGEGYRDLGIYIGQLDGKRSGMKMEIALYNSKKEELHKTRSNDSSEGQFLVTAGTYYVKAQDLNNVNNGKTYKLLAFVTEEIERFVTRIQGSDRYETAARIAMESRGFGYAENIVLASGQDFPDALAGGPLAFHLDAELLLTQKNKLSKATEEALIDLKTKNVTIIGGTGAVSSEVESYLKDNLNINVNRISGKDRYATAAAVAAELPKSDQAVVAYGKNFPDALSISPYAAKNKMPILLTETNSVPVATAEALKNYGETIAVGGNGVISEDVLEDLPDAKRLSGKDRYRTSVAITDYFGWELPASYLATGEGYADALSGSLLSAKTEIPLLLTTKNELAPSTKAYLKNNYKYQYFLLGGQGAIESTVERDLMDLLIAGE